jgi:hypothetical protein
MLYIYIYIIKRENILNKKRNRDWWGIKPDSVTSWSYIQGESALINPNKIYGP